jgi:hypothetical protein
MDWKGLGSNRQSSQCLDRLLVLRQHARFADGADSADRFLEQYRNLHATATLESTRMGSEDLTCSPRGSERFKLSDLRRQL